LCVFVGRGVGTTRRPGLVRVGTGRPVEERAGPGVLAAVVGRATASVAARVGVGSEAGTTSTTGTDEGVPLGVGAATTPVAVAVGVGATVRREGPPDPLPTAQAMPVEPTTATVASTTTGPWLRAALCRPIAGVFHRPAPALVAAWAK